jgi:CBS domain-containing membrane protein
LLEELRRTGVSILEEERPLFPAEERVARAIGYLRERAKYEVFGYDEGFTTATIRDLLVVKDLRSTRLARVFYPVPHVDPNARLGEAARLMFEYRLRALPVQRVNEDRLKVVSAQGILRRIGGASIAAVNASSIMTSNLAAVKAEASALRAKSLMLSREIDHLPVLRNEKLYGIVTSSNLLFNLLPSERVPSRGGATRSGIEKVVRFDYPVRNLAEETVAEVEVDADVSEVVDLMARRNSTYVLVRRGEEIQGIITLRDVLKLVIEKVKRKTPFYIVGLPEGPFESEASKMKFERLARFVSKALPSVEEIRAIVKTKTTGHGRMRYEVSINVYSPRQSYVFHEGGYDLPELFDVISSRLKRIPKSRRGGVADTRFGSPRTQSKFQRT